MWSPIQANPYPSLVDDQGHVHPSLYAIAHTMFPEECPAAQAPLEDWNTFLQAHFLRKAGTDHQDIRRSEQLREHEILMPHFEALGLIDAHNPQTSAFQYVVVFGGTPEDSQERFRFCLQAVLDQKIQGTDFIYINGHRLLHPSELEWLKEHNFPSTIQYQHEAAEAVWNELTKDIKDKPHMEFFTIQPPAGKKRADTEDTVREFVKQKKPTSAVFITNSPYGPYQNSIMRFSVLKTGSTVSVETMSSQCNSAISTTSLLDTLARWFYTICMTQKHQESALQAQKQ